jgi:hypothetical protein
MKKTLMILFTLFIGCHFALAQDQAIKSETGKSVAWDKNVHDFGDLEQGNPATAKFTFTNNGKAPVTITKVKSSCGCTVANYTKEPVMPGETGFVKATYNSKRIGNFMKTISVTLSDSESIEVLRIKGKVQAAEAQSAKR